MLCHCLPAETRPRDSSSYQAVWAEQVRPLWLPRGITSRDRALSLTGFTPASRALALLTTEREVRPEEAEWVFVPTVYQRAELKTSPASTGLPAILQHSRSNQIHYSHLHSLLVFCAQNTRN